MAAGSLTSEEKSFDFVERTLSKERAAKLPYVGLPGAA
jgi:hypothetical protein